MKPLKGWQVLVPRGGDWGHRVAGDLRNQGAIARVVPLINFSPAEDQQTLQQHFDQLAAGDFDWLVVTSATTVDVMTAMQLSVPRSTKVVAVGEATALGLNVSGYHVDFIPSGDFSGKAIVEEFPAVADPGAKVLIAQSEIADPQLAAGLRVAGLEVTTSVAYRTLGVAAGDEIKQAVSEGEINAILVTSGSVATQISSQFGALPESTKVVSIGPKTAHDARELGLTIHAIARERSTASLIDALIELAGGEL